MKKLDLGCGFSYTSDAVRVDVRPEVLPDVLVDLDVPGMTLPFEDNEFDQVHAIDLLEHIRHILPLMQEAHRVCKPDGKFFIAVPYASSDEAVEDPTHVRYFTAGSWGYFSQPFYWRASYGYEGDWQPEHIWLMLRKELIGLPPEEVMSRVNQERNTVVKMRVELRCIKPIREAKKELIARPDLLLLAPRRE